MIKTPSPDPIFSEPRLAQIYDTFDGSRDDLEPYLEMVKDFEPRTVVDLGCGTGVFALLLAENGIEVTGIDPAKASIDIARSKPGADKVKWIIGDASAIESNSTNMIVMTGNTIQAITDQDQWIETLRSVAAALKPGGYFIFETRKPEAKAWEAWTKEESFRSNSVPGIGQVDGWVDVIKVDLPLVSFCWTYYFHDDDTTLVSNSTLRFRTIAELTSDLEASGLAIQDVREAIDRPGKEYVVIAQKQQ